MDIVVNTTGAEKIAKLEKDTAALQSRNEKLTQTLGKQYLRAADLQKAYEALHLSNVKLTNDFAAQTARAATLDAEVVKLSADVKQLSAAQVTASAATAKTDTNQKKLLTSTALLAQAQRDLHSTARGTAGAFGALWLSYGNILPMVTAFGAAATVKGINTLGSSFEYLTKYAYQLSDASIPLGTLREEVLGMKDLAQTPKDLAGGLLELTKAGVTTTAALEDLPTVAKFATIAELDLAASTKQLVTIQNAFARNSHDTASGMLTLSETADIVAMAAQGSVASFSEMQTALTYVTALSSTAELSLSEVGAALMVMHDAGLLGSKGATAMRTALTRIMEPSSKVRQLLDKAGISMNKFAEGNKIKSLSEMFKELNRIHGLMSKAEWKEFSFQAFGFRGELIEAALNNTEKFEQNLTKLRNSAGFVSNAFSALSETTQMVAKNLVADFQRALTKVFDGEKATEVLTNLRDIVSSPGFAGALEDVAVGSYRIGEGLVGIIGSFYKLPTTVQEVGIISALFFGVKGKAVTAGLIIMADAISNIAWAVSSLNKEITLSEWAGMNSEQLATYRKGVEEYGVAYGKTVTKLADEQKRLANMRANPGVEGFGNTDELIKLQQDKVDKLKDQLSAITSIKPEDLMKSSGMGAMGMLGHISAQTEVEADEIVETVEKVRDKLDIAIKATFDDLDKYVGKRTVWDQLAMDSKKAKAAQRNADELKRAHDAAIKEDMRFQKQREQLADQLKKEEARENKAVSKFDRKLGKMEFDALPLSKYDEAVLKIDNSLKQELATLEAVITKDDIRYKQAQEAAADTKAFLLANDADVLKSGQSMTDGLRAGWIDLQNTAKTLGEATAEAFTSGFDLMTDALTDFVMTGKLSFKDFTKSVLSDISRIIVRQQMAGLLQMGVGLLFASSSGSAAAASSTNLAQGTATPAILNASVMHGGGNVGEPGITRRVAATLFDNAPRLHNGLKPDEFPTILQKGETVTPKGQTPGGVNITVAPNITVSSGAGGTPADRSSLANNIAAQITQAVKDVMVQEKRYGGILYRGA